MKKLIALLLAAIMLLPTEAMAWTDPQAKELPASQEIVRPEQMLDSDVEQLEPEALYADEEPVVAIIELEDEARLFASSSQRQLLRQQKSVENQISAKVLNGQDIKVLYHYTEVTNGFAAEVPYGKLDAIRALEDVSRVYVAPAFKVAPNMTATTAFSGGMENASGYKGEGTVIAIVDSGLAMDHPAFAAAPNGTLLDQAGVADVMSREALKAEDSYAISGELTASQVYHGGKVPFAYDYADKDVDVNPGRAGDHGTHVAGIASANSGVTADVVGVAPEAQLLAMKVFSSYGSGLATWENILAAMDDAVYLGADVINLSLGSTCGFSDYSWEEGVGETLQRITDAGVSLSVACGNEYSAAFFNRMGKSHALTRNPDYGTVASPSCYGPSLAVASVEKKSTMMSSYLTVGERRVAFNDTTEAPNVNIPSTAPSMKSLGTDVPLDYVVVPGVGEESDYEGLNVQGKIALVARGTTSYEAKKNAAKAAGASALLVYNNEPGMNYMQMDTYDLPAALIAQSDGKALAAVPEAQRKLTISSQKAEIESPTSGQMSDFSSWGVTPELTLKPDITAPGGNIKSTTVDGGYTTKSGTSMAAPFVSGALAVTRQYVDKVHADAAGTAAEKSQLVDALLMSTAQPVTISDVPYSPRKQGAGLVSVDNAVASPAYLTVGELGRPKLALGDDAAKTGTYTMSFNVHNWSDQSVTYTLGGTVQTDGAEVTKQYKGKDVWQVTELPHMLDAKIDAQTVTVAPGSAETVTATVTLTAADKQYLDERFENGSYVEGFLTLTPAEGGVQLSLPYMAFYGDWTRASVIDRGYFWNDLKNEENWATQYTNTAAATSLEGSVDTYLGDNPYHRGVPYLADRSAISPNGDDYMDKLDILYTGLLRNVATLTYTIADAENPDKVYYSQEMDHVTKSVYSPGYFRIVPAGVDEYTKLTPWDGKDHGISLKNDSKVKVTVSATLPDTKAAVNNECLSWSFPLTIDTEEPSIESVKVREENGKFFVDLTVKDNQYVSNVCFANSVGDEQLASYPVAEPQAGMTSQLSYDVTGLGQKLTLVVNDYAGNRREMNVQVDGNVDESQIIVPTRPVFTEDFETETFPANGWKVESHSAKTWVQAMERGSRMAICDASRTEQQNEWLITPVIDLSAQETKAGMVFDFYANYYWSVEQHSYNLKVKASTNGRDWEDIWQLWEVKNEFAPGEKTQAKVIIPDKFQKAPQVQFAFVYEGMDGTDLWMDNVQVYVEDPAMLHTITATANAGGTISPEGAVKITDGMSRTFTITPDAGYLLADVKVDGTSVGPVETYTFEKVVADHTIQAVFSPEQGGDTAVLISEDFESQKMPGDWTVSGINADYTWKAYKYWGHYGAYCPVDHYDPDPGFDLPGNPQDERLILPAQDLSSRDSASLSFQFTGTRLELERGNMTATVEVSTDEGKTWNELWNAKDALDGLKEGVISDYVATGDIVVRIPNQYLHDGVLLAFRYQHPKQSTEGGPVFVDNVKLLAVGGNTPAPDPDPQPPVNEDLLNADFNDQKLPQDWEIRTINKANPWKIKKYYSQLGAGINADTYDPYDPEFYPGDAQDELLITSALNLNGKTGTVSFQFSGKAAILKQDGMTVTLEASADGDTWTPIWNAKDTADTMKSGVLSDYVDTADITVEIPAEFCADGVRFAFRYVRPARSEDGGPVFVDNVVVSAQGGNTPAPDPDPQPPVNEDLLNEDFNDQKLPQDWEIRTTNTANPWKIKKYYSQLGAGINADTYDPYDPEFYPGDAQDELLITSALNLNGKTGTVSFQFSGKAAILKQDGMTVTLEASADGDTWTPIWNAKDTADTMKSGVLSDYVDTADITVEIPAEFCADGVRFAFRYVRPAHSEDGGPVFVDNVVVSAQGGNTPAPDPDPQPPVVDEALLNEDFEKGTMPEGWTVLDTNSDASYTWMVKKYFQRFGAYCDADLYDDWGGGGWSLLKSIFTPKAGAKQDERLVTPVLAMNGRTGTLSFQFTANKNSLKWDEMTATLEASVTGGESWTELWNAKDALDSLKEGVISDYVGTGDIMLDIPAEFCVDGVQFAFRYQRPAASADGGPVFVDNVKVVARGGETPEPPASEFIISASALQGGNIDPRGDVTVPRGSSRTFTITASEGYKIADVLVDGVSVGAVSAYTFEQVDQAHTIEARFEQIPQQLPTAVHEDFNNSGELPDKWMVEGPSAGYHYETWKVGRFDALNNTNVMLCTQNIMFAQRQNEKLYLPEIQMEEGAVLSFDWGATYEHLSNGMIGLSVAATLDKGDSWTTLWNAADTLLPVEPESAPQNVADRGEIRIPANFCVPGARFAFVFTADLRNDGAAAIDNVNLTVGGETPAPALYAITVADMAHGTVIPSKTVAEEGETITLNVQPDQGYRLKEGSLMAGDIVVRGNTFLMPDKAVEISALFEKIPVAPETPAYKDGVYQGTAQGHEGPVTVEVTVTDGAVASVTVLEQNETPEYWAKAEAMLDRLVGKTNNDSIAAVDTVTNATVSSEAIRTATLNALEKAVEVDSGIFDAGNGTEKLPYIIRTVKQLTDFAASVNKGETYADKFIALDTDLDLAEVAWTPIGTSDHDKYTGFAGTFDGRNHTVRNITCGTSKAAVDLEAVGFFGVIENGGEVRNLNLQITKFYNASSQADMVCMGGLAGILDRNATIDHCSVISDDLTLSEASSRDCAMGGIVGKMNNGSVVSSSWSNAGLTYGAMNFGTPVDVSMGGICGIQGKNSLMVNCASFGSVPGMVMSGVLRIGGLAGMTSGSIYNCYTTSLTKANIVGLDPQQKPEPTTAIGHLIGCSETGASLYQCYYDKNAKQFNNTDMAGEPAEGKPERRQAAGWDPVTRVKTDLSHVTACTAAELMKPAFAGTMNDGLRTRAITDADAYFAEKQLGSSQVADTQADLASGYYQWEQTASGVVLPKNTQKLNVSVDDIAIQQDIRVGVGTPVEQLGLPETVAVTLSTNTVVEMPVVWDTSAYVPNAATTYKFQGELTLPEGIGNPNHHKAHITVIVLEEAPARYSITVDELTNGTVEADKTSAQAGETVTLTVKPFSGYQLKIGSLKANDTVIAGTSFTMPAEDVTITAIFEKTSTPPTGTVYEDGVYEGEAMGHGGLVKVRVTVTGGAVASIDVVSQNETPEYWEKAETIRADLLGKTDNDSIAAVDTVTNATESSKAIKEAVLNALEKAIPSASGIFASGEGTEKSPYIIKTLKQLTDFAASVNGGENYKGKYIALDADMNLSELIWVPIGTSDHDKYTGFAGTFDGRGHTVSELTCGTGKNTVAYEALGFFGVVENGGQVRNLNVQIAKTYNMCASAEQVYSGGLVGILDRNAIIDHCSVISVEDQAMVEASGKNGAVGGIAGKMLSGSVIANCWTDVGLSVGTYEISPLDISMGGICGQQMKDSLIVNSASFGSVAGMVIDGTLRIGGLAGRTAGAIFNCTTASLTKANIMGLDPQKQPEGTTAIGHLIGCSETGAALYQCYYDKNAPQFSNTDLAGEPAEGKPERRQAAGWDVKTQTKTDLSHVTACETLDMTKAAFAAQLTAGLNAKNITAAEDYFTEHQLLGKNALVDAESALDSGFYTWELVKNRVLPANAQTKDMTIVSVARQSSLTVKNGTAVEDLKLPATVEITLSSGRTIRAEVRWSCENYDPAAAGDYTFVGQLMNLPQNVLNPHALTASLTVTVMKAVNPNPDPTPGGGGSGGGGGFVPPVEPEQPELPFTDVNKTDYYYDSIQWAVEKKITNGLTETTFAPDLSCTRAQMVTFLWRAAGCPEPKAETMVFTDVAPDAYCAKAILWAVELGITKGVTETTFMPNATVTRAQTVTFLWRSAKSPAAGISGFADVPADAYYAEAVAWADRENITNGVTETTFMPDANCTRGQIVTFLYRFYN